ncbi:MAG: DUF2207 domain-containing protein [Bacteroidales bacterium]|nr:DUF2207 domain-containing protein [Bacteroidales bacterium]
MRKLLYIAFLAALLFPQPAAGQRIDSVKVQASVRADGSVMISQVWVVNVVSGTEWYLPVREDNGVRVAGLMVTEMVRNPKWAPGCPPGTKYFIPVSFESEGRNWNTDRTLEEKANKCGINPTPEGCELCWGQGSMGDHRWIATYLVNGLVQSLNDCDAFNFMFINTELAAPPGIAEVRIKNETGGPAWTEENVKFWGFGYDGRIELVDGEIVARTAGAMLSHDSMIIMMRFEKGMLSPVNVREIDFETMKEQAFKGSEWEKEPDSGSSALGLVAFFLIILGIIDFYNGFIMLTSIVAGISILIEKLIALLGFEWRKSIMGRSRFHNYFREAPLEGDLPMAFCVLDKGLRDTPKEMKSRLIGAYFLKWILDGRVRVQAESDNSGKRAELVFNPDAPENGDEYETRLYGLCLQAAGENRILEDGEFRKWAKEHNKLLIGWLDNTKKEAEEMLCRKGWLDGGKSTAQGREEFAKLAGFRNFLRDFTLVDQREAAETGLWKNYLVYAALFGIADRVAEQFKKLYPGHLVETVNISREITAASVAVASSEWYRAKRAAEQSFSSSRRMSGSDWHRGSSGRGGYSSRGGGGGYSGGGRGGGSR